MKLKIGYKWKSIEGISKGKTFKITDVSSDSVTYKSEETGATYLAKRKFFEKYIERVSKFWAKKNKSYKKRKEKLRNER